MVGRPKASSSKGCPLQIASAADEASASKNGSFTRARTSRTGSRTTRWSSYFRSWDQKKSKSLETPQGIAEGQVTKAVDTGKFTVLLQVAKANPTVLGPCTLGVSATSPLRTAHARAAKPQSGRGPGVRLPISTSAGTKRSGDSDEVMEVEEVVDEQPRRKGVRKE